MPRNSSGTYSATAGNPVVTQTTITSTWANLLVADLGAEITSSLDRSGRGGMLAGLKLFDGSEALPGLSFSNEPSTGLFRAASGVIAMVTTATSIARFSDALIEFLTAIDVNGPVNIDGVLTADSLVTSGDAFIGGTIAADPAVNAADLVQKAQLDAAFADAVEVAYQTDGTITVGRVARKTAGFTLNTGQAAGEIFGVYNDSAAGILVTQGSGLTLRLSGTTSTGNRTIPPRGMAVFYPISTTEYIMSGSNLS